jgi:hypothetical protein
MGAGPTSSISQCFQICKKLVAFSGRAVASYVQNSEQFFCFVAVEPSEINKCMYRAESAIFNFSIETAQRQ